MATKLRDRRICPCLHSSRPPLSRELYAYPSFPPCAAFFRVCADCCSSPALSRP
jgi:hypothetical protein